MTESHSGHAQIPLGIVWRLMTFSWLTGHRHAQDLRRCALRADEQVRESPLLSLLPPPAPLSACVSADLRPSPLCWPVCSFSTSEDTLSYLSKYPTLVADPNLELMQNKVRRRERLGTCSANHEERTANQMIMREVLEAPSRPTPHCSSTCCLHPRLHVHVDWVHVMNVSRCPRWMPRPWPRPCGPRTLRYRPHSPPSPPTALALPPSEHVVVWRVDGVVPPWPR